MKFYAFILLLSFPVVFSACAPSQVSTPPPPLPTAVIETEAPAPMPAPEPAAPPPVVAPEPATPAPAPAPGSRTGLATAALSDSISEKRLERALEPKTLLQIIRAAGVPDNNLTPGRKEQIAVYQHDGKYEFYLFRDSRLIASGEYPRSVIEEMQQQGTYPQEVIRDFYRLLQ